MLSIIQKLMFAFVTLIIGLVLIGSIATSTGEATDLLGVTSEVHNVLPTIATGRNATDINATIRYTITNAPTSWKVDQCPITSFVLKNSSGSAFTETTDYIFTASSGTYTLVNSATAVATLPVANNNTYASYAYCPDDYVIGWGGTVLDLVPGFFALALLIFSVGMFYSVARETGIV